MGKKWRTCRAVVLACWLVLGVWFMASSVSHGGWRFTNSVTVIIINQSQGEIGMVGYILNEGDWAQGLRPNMGPDYPNNSTIGPMGTVTSDMNQGNGATLWLDVGTITWQMPWFGQPQIKVHLRESGLTAQTEGPFPDPDNQHVRYEITINKQ